MAMTVQQIHPIAHLPLVRGSTPRASPGVAAGRAESQSSRYCTDGWGAYERHVEAEQHTVGKAHTQRIERKHINLRTRIKRLVRRTICLFRDRAYA